MPHRKRIILPAEYKKRLREDAERFGWLKKLRPGDEVIVREFSRWRIQAVDAVIDKRIYLRNPFEMFYVENGRSVADFNVYLEEATPKRKAELKHAARREQLLSAVENVRWARESNRTLASVLRILRTS